MSVNGYLQTVSVRSQRTLDKLRQAAETLGGGWAQAILDAKRHKIELDTSTGMTSTDSESTSHLAPPAPRHRSLTPLGTPPIPASVSGSGLQTSYVDPDTASALRKRLVALSDANGVVDADAEDVVKGIQGEEKGSDKKNDDADEHLSPAQPHPLIDHPNEEIAELAREYTELQGELTSSGPLYVTWPNNITLKNFAVYMLIPTLVYMNWSIHEPIGFDLFMFSKRPWPLSERSCCFTARSFVHFLDLSLPFMLAYLLLFYIIFECICNGFAELSYFADRQFYEDWWNSTSWDEFSRKWNKPVHMFLLRHVYQSTMVSYKLSRNSAMFVTFLLSACVHELVMVIVTKKFRFYLFALQLIQIPLITISRIPAIKRNKMLGNLVFWLGLYAGFPLLCVAYVAY
ncbi:Sterol O-acyltransferase 2 (Sterol-ester synthase 2) [Paramarasmius palmivorus]|uniref:Sterol O-acyltransferase 2 (Sterol-ester synthase 2) n=1 Tax=Paramarasmius palmivorus TaxID=297713 RepID=A0AAW0EA87_9AGAR